MKYTLQDCIEYANSKNGKCLSLKYVSNKNKMKWECNKGHSWLAPLNSITSKKTWCSICSTGKSENKVRKIFETIFNKEFKSIRPSFLRNPVTGRNLELDGYCEELNLAFEYDGRMHFEDRSSIEMTKSQKTRHSSLSEIQARDRLKNTLCSKAGIVLVRIPYWENNNLEEFILNKIKEICHD